MNITMPPPSTRRPAYAALKSAFDFGVALVLSLLALPVMLLAGLLVKLTSRGPVLYSQTRVGRLGRPFRIYKIRTMYHNCEAQSGARWSTKNDPRVTPVGRVLRKLHLDELPQLWNILCGDMSLVGPRPERPEFVNNLVKLVDGYEDRLAVKPGLTGLAQIQLPPDTNLQSVRDKVALDRVYIDRAGFWLDVRLMIGTALYLLGVSYAGVRRVMRLPEAPAAPAVETAGRAASRVPAAPAAMDSLPPAEKEPQPQMTSV